MARICLVACVREKLPHRARAEDLYTSPLFAKARQFARDHFDRWYILSAQHGVLRPDDTIEPYDRTLNNLPASTRREWANSVLEDLLRETSPEDELTFLAGIRYREYLEQELERRGYRVSVPLEGRSIGVQLQWLTRMNGDLSRSHDLARFYGLVSELERGLGGKVSLAECRGNMDWPERGVYILFEPDEWRTLDASSLRVVRVGTHMVSRGSNATLWNRLRTHRGTENGGGNHRGSIFRLHVGSALIEQAGGRISLPTWGKGQSAPADVRESEKQLERRVSGFVGKMSLLWLNIPDEASPWSDRCFIERNSIGLLAGPSGPLDLPSTSWLGRYCPNPCVGRSGLWNVDFVDYRYDRRFLEVFEQYVDATVGRAPMPDTPIAPPDWYAADTGKAGRGQLLLFGDEV